VVRDLDIDVSAGEVHLLLGPNGAGKTTTLLTMAGDLAAVAGTVEIDGTAVTSPLHRRARDGISLITEERSVFMRQSARDNLRVGRADIDVALALFPELEPHLDRAAGVLSGGQQQMLTLARALARSPRVLLADELSLGLAPMVVGRLLAAVRSAADDGVAVLLVEQHVARALAIADRVSVLVHGRLVMSGPADELRAQPELLAQLYLAAGSATGGDISTNGSADRAANRKGATK
jgi:ABC-type branched-subunit amino acid transport system ATPase component